MRVIRHVVIACALLAAPSSLPAAAQQPQRPLSRADLERRIELRTAQIIRQRLQLTEAQMQRLAVVNRRFEPQRRALRMRERRTRLELRTEIARGNTANQSRVSALLDQILRIQRERLDVLAAEQRDLAAFMTPVQRAQYFGLQNELRQRVEQLRSRGGRGMRRPPPGRGPN